MQRFKSLLFLLFFTGSISIYAQKSAVYTYQNFDFDEAIALYNGDIYLSAQLLFENIKLNNTSYNVQSDCSYYIAFCAIKLDQVNADVLMEKFVADYPTSSRQNQAFLGVANYYFEQTNYAKATSYFEKIDETTLSTDEVEKINFRKGYAFFISNKKKEAAIYFNKVINSINFGSQAKYYLGFIAYDKDDYIEANKQFEQVADEQKFQEKISYFQADMNFKLGNFNKAIDLGIYSLPKATGSEQSELCKIIGESYFNLKQYDKALPYLKKYQGKKGKWNNTDFYQLGYTFYKQNDFKNAISQFSKIIDGKDYVSQNAFYHLGESYLKLNKKQEALNSFKNASEMNFDKKIQEDAAFNYAKLSYDLGNSYQSVPEILHAFLINYPNSKNKKEIEMVLISSYVTSKNYKEALVLLDKNNFPENRLAYQKVTYYYGLQLFTDGNYLQANDMFLKSLQNPKDVNFTVRANFWKGETEFIRNDFDNAILSFKMVERLTEGKTNAAFKNINYSIAYCNFKRKQYDEAAKYFQKQIATNQEDKIILNDSYLRLGDCQFVATKYALGLESYNKAMQMKGIDNDYAQYQKAISYGFVGKNDKKIEEFNLFLQNNPSSRFRDDALFELANTYVAVNKTDMALKTYDNLNTEFKNGSFTSKSLLKQGLIYYNNQNDDEALSKFKKVAADYPKSPDALEAIATARLIYIDNAKVDEYATWVTSLGFVDVTDADLDNDTFESAEKNYLQVNKKTAINSLRTYLSKFSNGLHLVKANFYLAQLYFLEGQDAAAIPNYNVVISKPRNEFTEQSLTRLCEIFLKKNDFAKAIPVLKQLETEADFLQNATYAQSNLMRAYYDQKEFTNAIIYAEKVMANVKTDAKIKADAQIIIARSALQLNDGVKAKIAYANLLKIATGELAAEALFYDAYFKNKENKFADSNKSVQKLAKEYSSYKYFGAKALVVMAKNYYQLKDAFQATSILKSVIENFANFNDIVDDAKQELDKIKAEEAKTNSSVTK